MENLEYAAVLDSLITDPSGFPPKDVTSNARFENIHSSWDPGVKAALYYNPGGDWGYSLLGVYLHSKSKGQSIIPPILGPTSLTYQIPLIDPVFMGNIVQTASAEWTLDFGYLDLLINGSFSPWANICLMPNCGLRAVWLEQRYTANYDNVFFLVPLDPGFATAPHAGSQRETRYQAIGLKMGSDFEIPCLPCFSIIGGVGGSLFYGPASSNTFINGFNPEVGAADMPVLTTLDVDIHNKIWQLRANVETELGLAYYLPFRSLNCIISASYLFSLWFDQNNFYNLAFASESNTPGLIAQNFIIPEKESGNLQLQGLNLQLTFCF